MAVLVKEEGGGRHSLLHIAFLLQHLRAVLTHFFDTHILSFQCLSVQRLELDLRWLMVSAHVRGKTCAVSIRYKGANQMTIGPQPAPTHTSSQGRKG